MPTFAENYAKHSRAMSSRSAREAENGGQAIEQARTCRPQLIVLDLSMPVMNGLEAAPELRKIVPECPIILYTSFAETVPKSDLEARGITLALSKHMPLEGLLAKAEELLQTGCPP